MYINKCACSCGGNGCGWWCRGRAPWPPCEAPVIITIIIIIIIIIHITNN